MRRAWVGTALLILIACLAAGPGRAAQKPLSRDDVQLLLLGGATEQRMLALVSARGVDFAMTPALEKRFRDAGATDPIIEALEKAGPKPGEEAPSAPVTSSSSLPPSGHDTSAPAPPASSPAGSAGASQVAPELSEPVQAPASASVNQKIAAILDGLSSHPHERLGEYPYAPMFSLKDLSGKKLDLHDYKGEVVMLDFWATWCGPCRSEIPKFIGLERQYHDQGFQLIGVSVDQSSGPVRSFYQRYGMNYPVALCDSYTRNAYGGIAGVPTTLLIGRDGRIYATVVGAPADLGYFEQEIHTLLAEPATPPGVQMASAGSAGGSAAHPPTGPSSTRPSGTAAVSASTGPSRAATTPAAPSPAPSLPSLTDPSPDEIQKIIQAFAAKEELFKEARDGYTYHQINKVETLDADDQPTGEFEQDWDILYDDTGKRIERVTYAPLDTLKDIQMTEQDLDAFRNLQPFVLTTSELPEYDVEYLGHVKLDQLTAYVFRVRPKVIEKGRQYFQGVIWVDDRDLQIVKAEGKNVPETRGKKGNENLFPRFTTWREQIDGKFWFPTFTMADDTLYFSTGAAKVREIVKYADYKQFKSTVKEKILVVMPDGKTQELPKNPPKDQKP